MDDRRTADLHFKNDIGQRLTAIEVSSKLYHDELKSIMERLHSELEAVKQDVTQVRSTLYGGPENKIGLLGKMAMATTALIFIGGFLLKPFEALFDHYVLRKIGEDPAQQMIQQSTKKRLQLFNRKTGQYEYYMEYQPVGTPKGEKSANP